MKFELKKIDDTYHLILNTTSTAKKKWFDRRGYEFFLIFCEQKNIHYINPEEIYRLKQSLDEFADFMNTEYEKTRRKRFIFKEIKI